MPVFIILALATLMAWREPQGMMVLYPPTPEPVCDCSDFATQFEAQQCFDSCCVVRGFDVHRLDADRARREVKDKYAPLIADLDEKIDSTQNRLRELKDDMDRLAGEL